MRDLASNRNRWYSDWQDQGHVRLFDFRSGMSAKNLIRHYETLNDVLLLRKRLHARGGSPSLLEVGCATGEFYRYLKLTFPSLEYYGMDLSRPAIERALEKYPQVRFTLTSAEGEPGFSGAAGLASRPDFVYAKDVVHHQTDPYGFLTRLLDSASDSIVFRCRTRDVGPTVFDPDQSCQYHYHGWMPYIVTNTDELVAEIQEVVPRAEIVVWRNHMILGGQHNRYLPRECYLEETGTAETAVRVGLRSEHPGRVTIEDRAEPAPRYTIPHMARQGLRLGRSLIFGSGPSS